MAQTFLGIENCACPDATIPASMQVNDCFDNIGQIYRIFFVASGGAEPFLADGTDITLQATWTAAKAALAPDTLFLTPQIQSGVFSDGATKVIAGDTNDTPKGAEIPTGHNTIKFDFSFVGLTTVQMDALLKWFSCKQTAKVGFITSTGQAVVHGLASDPSVRLFKVVSMKMDGPTHAGLGAQKLNAAQITLEVPEWAYQSAFDITSFFEVI